MTRSIQAVFIFLLLVPVTASANWPDFHLTTANVAYQDGPVTLLVVPDGSGDPFTSAQTPLGNGPVDGTITLHLIDQLGVPITNYPLEDLWLESADGGLIACPTGTVADAPTDNNGLTTWTSALVAGGSSQATCYILISGFQLSHLPLAINFTSPDLNGDLEVNLSDVPIFAGDYFGPYQFRADFHLDGRINLSDLVLMSRAMGRTCP